MRLVWAKVQQFRTFCLCRKGKKSIRQGPNRLDLGPPAVQEDRAARRGSRFRGANSIEPGSIKSHCNDDAGSGSGNPCISSRVSSKKTRPPYPEISKESRQTSSRHRQPPGLGLSLSLAGRHCPEQTKQTRRPAPRAARLLLLASCSWPGTRAGNPCTPCPAP